MWRGMHLLLRWIRRLCAAAVSLVLLACLSAAATADGFSVTVVDESLQDPPVIITSATARAVDNGTRVPDYWFLTDVGLQNSTYKPVAAVRIQWDLYNPGGQYLGSYAEELRQESANAPLLMAGAVRSVVWNRNHIYLGATKAVVGLTVVLFQDGSRWQLRQSGQATDPRGPGRP